MERRAPPQFSADRRWWWNGYYWVPSGQQANAAPGLDGEPRPGLPGAFWIAILAIVVLAGVAAVPSLGTWLIHQRLPSINAPALPVPAPTIATTPPPSSGSDSNPATVDGYRQMVNANLQRIQSAGQSVTDQCAPKGLARGTAACATALKALDGAVTRFRSDLDAQSPPACLRDADTRLRSGLDLTQQAVRQMQGGLDNGDVTAAFRGAAALSQAAADFQSASDLLSSSC